jgi:hypothetical protein
MTTSIPIDIFDHDQQKHEGKVDHQGEQQREAPLGGEAEQQQQQQGKIDFSITIIDPDHQVDDLDAAIVATVKAAGADWAGQFAGPADGSPVTIEIEVDISAITPRAASQSNFNVPVDTSDGFTVVRAGVADKISTAGDANGAAPDATIFLNPNYAREELFFDPEPTTRGTMIPGDRTDAVSVFEHEIGHDLGIDGFRDLFDPTSFPFFPPNTESVFDTFIAVDAAGGSFFTGLNAEAVHGGPVPLTLDNIYHVGNDPADGPGSELIGDLMNGVVFFRGTQYEISDLDLAIMRDLGLTVTGSSGDNIAVAIGVEQQPDIQTDCSCAFSYGNDPGPSVDQAMHHDWFG